MKNNTQDSNYLLRGRRGRKCDWGRIHESFNPFRWVVGSWVLLISFFFKPYTHTTIYYILFSMFDIFYNRNVKAQKLENIHLCASTLSLSPSWFWQRKILIWKCVLWNTFSGPGLLPGLCISLQPWLFPQPGSSPCGTLSWSFGFCGPCVVLQPSFLSSVHLPCFDEPQAWF